jgi:MYXO-CTERM domain-containing protein
MTRPTRRGARLLAGIGAIALATGLGLAAAAPAYAATFTVTDGSASGPNTLNQAILDLNASLAAGTIQIAPGLAINMGAISAPVMEPVIVLGNASNPPTITGPSIAAPIFQVINPTDFEMDNVKMVGQATSGSPITFVNSAATVKLIGDTISNFPHPAVEFLLQTGPVTITDCTFSHNSSLVADADGGAISAATVGDVTITGSTFDHNTALHHGGALFLGTAHSVNISGSTFDSNTATDDGGAIEIASIGEDSTWTGDTFTGNSAGATAFAGGAAFLMGTVAADTAFVIDQSTFSGNSSATGATSTTGAVGWVGTDNGTVQLTNSTMTGNSFTGGTNGTGIDLAVLAIAANAEFDVVQSTLDESAAANGLLFTDSNSGFLRLASSTLIGPGVLQVLANSSAAANAVETRDTIAISTTALPAFGVGGTPAEISYSITSDVAGLQLVDVGTTQFGVTDPQLGALANNGGLTKTRLPLAGSPAIDTGDPTFTTPLTDQRGAGFPRIVNGRVDIGAVESPAPTLAATGVDPAPTVWTASTALLTGALLLGAALLIRRRRNTAQ